MEKWKATFGETQCDRMHRGLEIRREKWVICNVTPTKLVLPNIGSSAGNDTATEEMLNILTNSNFLIMIKTIYQVTIYPM